MALSAAFIRRTSRPPSALRASVLAAVVLVVGCAILERSAVAQSETVAEPVLLVIGGTPSGVAAAVSAARRGENVTLLVSGDRLGGALTGAMLDQWDFNRAPGGASVQRGLFDEMYRRLGDTFAPQAAAAVLAEMVAAEPRILVRYDEVPVAVTTSATSRGKRIEGITTRNRRSSDLSSETAPFVVDATDDADVAALAGARYDVGRQDTGRDLHAQAVTVVFAIDGVDWNELKTSYDRVRFGRGGATERRVWGYATLMRAYRPGSAGVVVPDLNLARLPDGTATVNAIDVYGVDGLDARQLAAARGRAIAEAPRLVDFLRRRIAGLQHARLKQFADDVYVRETRHVAGLELLTAADVWAGRVPDDSIGLASYPLDLHLVDAADRQTFAPQRHVYGVPFGALVPKGFVNLTLASPAISATHLAAGSARIVPTTIEEGEATGAAAVLAAHAGLDDVQLATRPAAMQGLRDDLERNGAVVRLAPNAPSDAGVAAQPAIAAGAVGRLAAAVAFVATKLALDGSPFLGP